MSTMRVVVFPLMVSLSLSGCNCDNGTGPGDGGPTGGGTGVGGGSGIGGGNAGGGVGTGGGASSGGGTGGGSTTNLCAGGDLVLVGPLPYLQKADSPLPCSGMSEFYFDDFEDHQINLPGVSHNARRTAFGSAGEVDSVDGDDTRIDGNCIKGEPVCDSLFADAGFITLSFDAGALPLVVGLVWTDGFGEITFEAYGADGGLLGVIGPVSQAGSGGFPDDGNRGGTSEDRFFGVAAAGGISSVRISNTDGGIEIDHVQYGR
jgi:hypothetical protein